MKSDAIVGALKEAAKLDVDVETALDQLTELVESAHGPSWKNVEAILAEVPLGTPDGRKCVVAWDTCGTCRMLLRKCSCKGGPTEPRYIKFFRSGQPMDPNTSTGTMESTPVRATTRVTSTSSESSLPEFIAEGVPSGTEDNTSIPARGCRDCGQQVLVTEGEENDDGTFTCYPCQAEGSTQ